jgi:hypothetical protein
MRQAKTPPCARTDGLFFVQSVEQYVGLPRTPSSSFGRRGTGENIIFTVLGNGNLGLETTTPAGLLRLHSEGNNTIRMTTTTANHTNSGTIDFLEGTGTFAIDATG